MAANSKSNGSSTETVQQPRPAALKYPSCTHLTMTRLYTTEFQCSNCCQKGSFGWLYRCTQDRELMLEDDLDKGHVQEFDSLGKMFERPMSPKRGPLARMSKTAFLEEISEEQLKTYSQDQIDLILEQRSHVLNTAASQAGHPNSSAEFVIPTQSIFSKISPFKVTPKPAKKPWIPIRGGECQFKCCHRCRPNLGERSLLSLNGVANGDIPMTAITGFGFHLQKFRPVAKKEVVEKLGLKENPSPVSSESNYRSQSSTNLTTPVPKEYSRTTANCLQAGLGISAVEQGNTTQGFPFPASSDYPNIATHGNGSAYSPDIQKVLTTLFPPRPEVKVNAPKPPIVLRTSNVAKQSPKFLDHPLPSLPRRVSPTLSAATKTPLPEMTEQELEAIRRPLTPMEKNEAEGGWFGSKPLEVRDGVAVTEEGVEGHFADLRIVGEGLITQF